MGRIRNSSTGGIQAAHRPGPLVQANKKHKAGKHRTKGMLDTLRGGRVTSESSSLSKRFKHQLKRADRRKQATAIRNKKIRDTVDLKKSIGGLRGAPISITLLPLSSTCNPGLISQHIVEQAKGFSTLLGTSGNATHLRLSNGKNIALTLPTQNDFWSYLDILKMSDIVLFLLPILEPLSDEAITFLKCAKDQGLTTCFLGVSNEFSKAEEKLFLKSLHKTLPLEKIYPLNNSGQVSNLLRLISVTKIALPKATTMRSGMIIENYKIIPSESLRGNIQNILPTFATKLDALEDVDAVLEVTGVVRRCNLDPNKIIHIPGSGNYQILRIDVVGIENTDDMVDNILIPPRFLLDPNKSSLEDDNSDMEDNMSVGTDDLDSEEDFDDGMSQSSETKSEKFTGGKRLPKGTSEYQADWLINSDSENDNKDDLIGSDEELESDGDKSTAGSDEKGDDDEEEEMDWIEEQKQLQLAKEARTEAEFPDWIDTPMDSPAKIRFQRYRGLQSFKTSPWDPHENLPKEYSKIVQFQNYRHTYKKVVVQRDDDGPGFIPVGQRIAVLLKPLHVSAIHSVGSSKPVVLISLLPHENKMSVLNLHLNVVEVFKNKEPLIFQVGFQRFQAQPILSEVSTGNKHKMLRFAQPGMSCMATVFCPIVFPIAPVLTFKTSGQTLIHLASGSVHSVDPARIVVKRILLSGYPYKSQGRKSTVRFMFFNREDIEWFKPVELKTRYGRRGHIKEPLGTHGHMKCVFDGPIKSQDTVLMPLYKRVFPKWTWDAYVPPFNVYDQWKEN